MKNKTNKTLIELTLIDEVGTFWLVTKSTPISDIEDILVEVDIFDIIFLSKGGLEIENILFISKDYYKALEKAKKEIYENRKLD